MVPVLVLNRPLLPVALMTWPAARVRVSVPSTVKAPVWPRPMGRLLSQVMAAGLLGSPRVEPLTHMTLMWLPFPVLPEMLPDQSPEVRRAGSPFSTEEVSAVGGWKPEGARARPGVGV